MCAEKFPLVSMGGRAEGFACADPGARTPIGASGNIGILTTTSTRLMVGVEFKFNLSKTSEANLCLTHNIGSLPTDAGGTETNLHPG